MKKVQNLILDFSHIYPRNIENHIKGLKRIDLSDIHGTDMYCTKEAEKEIRKRLEPFDPQGIHFLDSGNYHYVTKIFAEKIHFPFALVLFDYHNDMKQTMIHDLMSCGSWAGEMIRDNSYLQQLVLVGPEQESIDEIEPELKKKLVCISIQKVENKTFNTEVSKIRTDLPAYISIDKDVLNRYNARTNWNQGCMSVETLKNLLSDVFKHQRVIGVDICGECSLSETVKQFQEDEKINQITNEILYHFLSSYFPYEEEHKDVVMREYNNETSLWDSIYKESSSADLRKQNLSVEWMFDAGLLFLAQNTKKVLDFGCGSGDILFQYHQYAPENYGVGIDLSKEGIDSANETLQKSDYHNLEFLQGGMEKLETFRQGEFDGIILSNVLDVMPENVAQNLLNQASRILREGGYWFIKLNPYYTDDELKSFGYRQIQPHLYDENGVLRLRQETTEYWKKLLKEYGTIENYVEFCYWWQSGMNRLFLIKK